MPSQFLSIGFAFKRGIEEKPNSERMPEFGNIEPQGQGKSQRIKKLPEQDADTVCTGMGRGHCDPTQGAAF